jgi:hypothetical protein
MFVSANGKPQGLDFQNRMLDYTLHVTQTQYVAQNCILKAQSTIIEERVQPSHQMKSPCKLLMNENRRIKFHCWWSKTEFNFNE